jgi:hypothetical protein
MNRFGRLRQATNTRTGYGYFQPNNRQAVLEQRYRFDSPVHRRFRRRHFFTVQQAVAAKRETQEAYQRRNRILATCSHRILLKRPSEMMFFVSAG